ncbi:MAG: hypothetical protein V3R93_01080 [Candidatus Hydrothermarchaeaceae archaeon]
MLRVRPHAGQGKSKRKEKGHRRTPIPSEGRKTTTTRATSAGSLNRICSGRARIFKEGVTGATF